MSEKTPSRRHRRVGLIAGGIAVAMLGAAFASVPLYSLFCQATGYAGTPRRGDAPPTASTTAGDRQFTVAFDANIDPALPWGFRPEQKQVTLVPGEQKLIFYRSENRADHAVRGQALFNITPEKAAPYFVKIACFCFTEQTLKAGEGVDMPVTFYLDPAILDDPNLAEVKTITLSYTFFLADDQPKAEAAPAAGPAGSTAALVRPNLSTN